MKETKYILKNDPEKGFLIIERKETKNRRGSLESHKTGKIVYDVWYDEYEGGEAYYEDWDCIGEGFKNFQLAHGFILTNYGEAKKISEKNIEEVKFDEE